MWTSNSKCNIWFENVTFAPGPILDLGEFGPGPIGTWDPGPRSPDLGHRTQTRKDPGPRAQDLGNQDPPGPL